MATVRHTPPSNNKSDHAGPVQEHLLMIQRGMGELDAHRSATQRIRSTQIAHLPRVAEARTCLNTAKLHLNSSRNLKADIKTEVTQAIDRLYSLVKEAEADRGEGGNESLERKKDQEVERKEENEAWRKQLEEQNTLLKENLKLLKEAKMVVKQPQKPLTTMSYQELMTEVKAIRKTADEIQGRVSAMTSEVPSYAEILSGKAGKVVNQEKEVLHSVLISSKIEEETGDEVLEKIRKAVKAKEGWVQVEKVRKARDRKVIVGCKTQEDRSKIKKKLEEAGEHLVVEEVKNRDPLLILKEVLVMHTDEEVLKAFRNQNRDVFRDLEKDENRMTVKYRRRLRNPLTGHIILSVSPKIWRRATEKAKIKIDLQNVQVEDQTPLIQCTRCLGYGHSKRLCKEPVDLCSHCGGPHLRAECPDRLSGKAPICTNCVQAKKPNSAHNAFDIECPIRRKWDSLARASVAYC